MKHVQGVDNRSQSCSCTSCISVSTSPSLQRIIDHGSKIDKLFYGKFIPLRERKLIEKLVRTRAVYDDVRKQLLSGSNISINENANLKFKVHTASPKELDDIERSSAVLQLVDLVDKGVLLGPHKLNECCSCCSCSSKVRPHDYRYKGGKHIGYTRDQYLRSKSSVISKWSHRKGARLKRGLKFKAKHIQSEPCTCILKLSGLLKHHSKLRHKKKYSTQSRPTSEPKVLAEDANLRFYKNEYKTPENMSKKTREHIRRSKARIKGSFQSEIKKSRENLRHAKTAIRDKVDSMQREYEKREIVIPNQPEIDKGKQFHIKKDSITKFKERLKRNELLDYECEPECYLEECAPEECLKKIRFSKMRKGKRTEHKMEKSKKTQASSGHSLKRCLCPFKIHTLKEPKINAIETEPSTRFLAQKTIESKMIDTSMETEKKYTGVIKTQKNRCFCTLKLHTIGKLAQNENDYNKVTKPILEDIAPRVSTKGTKTKRQKIDNKNKTQFDRIEKLKRDKRNKKKQPQSMSMPTETQTIRHKIHLRSTECEPNVCMPGLCDPYECFEKIKKRDRHLQTELETTTNNPKMLIATSDATQNINRLHLNSYDREPYESMLEECDPDKCLEKIKNRDVRSSSDSGTQTNYSKLISKGSIAKSKVKQRHIYTKARKSHYKPTSLNSNSNEVAQLLGRAIKITSSFSFSIEVSKSRSNSMENSNMIIKEISKSRNQVPKMEKTTIMHDKLPGTNTIKRPILKRCLCTLNLQHNKSKRLQTPNTYTVHRMSINKTIRNNNALNVYSLSKLVQFSSSLSEKNKFKEILSCFPENQVPLLERPSLQPYIASSNVIIAGDCPNHCTYSAICFSRSNKALNTTSFHENIHSNERIVKNENNYDISHNKPYKCSVTSYNTHLSSSDVTGVSRLLKPCFCTMNIRIPNNMRGKKVKPVRHTLAPYECEPGVCIPYECDPYECQKLIMKRNKKQTSTMTGERLISRADGTRQTVYKDATAGIKSKASPSKASPDKASPDKATFSGEPPFKVSLNRPSPSRQVVKLSSNINFSIEFSKERFLKQLVKETPSKIIDKKSRKQGTGVKRWKDADSQLSTTKTEDKSSNTSPKRCFCTLKLHKAPKEMQAIENIDHFTKAPKRFLKDAYKLPTISTGQNTKKGWRPERLYEDKKNQTKNLSIEAKNSYTQSTFYSKGKSKQNQTQSQFDEKPIKPYIKPDIAPRQGIRIGSSLSFNIEFYKEKSPEVQAKFSKPERSHELQDVSSKTKQQIQAPNLKGIKAVRDVKPKSKRRKVVSDKQSKSKEGKTKKDLEPKLKEEKIKNDMESRPKGGKNMSDKQPKQKGVKSKSDMKPKTKKGKSINDVQSNKQKNRKIPEQINQRDEGEQSTQREVQPQASQSKSLHSKDTTVGNFIENNTSLFKRCFCKNKEKKIPRQIICMDKPVPETPSQSFLKKCACTFPCRKNNKHKEILTYHIQEHRFALPYECEPGICVPGDCDPYVCDKIIKARHLRHGTKLSGTERLRTKSTYSYYNPSTKGRSNQSTYYTRLKENKQQSPISKDNSSLDKQALRIGSNINFNIEFYKAGSERSGDESSTKNLTRIKPKTRSQGSFSNYPRLGRNTQVDGTRTEHRGVGTELKRCFCTLKYNLKPSSARQGTGAFSEENKGIDKRVTVQLHGRDSNRHKRAPYETNTRNMTQQTRFPSMNPIPYTLEPHECEPNVCIPGECDPYECLQRINRRNIKFRTYGTSPRHYGTKSTSSMAYSMSDNRSRRIQYGPKKRYNTRSMQSKPSRLRQSISSTPSESGRKAVKISSSLHLSIEFTKGGSSQNPQRHMAPVVVKPRRTRNVNRHSRGRKYSDTTLQTNIAKVESKGSGVGPLLKRCFCTLKLQKVGNLKPNVTPLQQNTIKTPVRSVKTNTKKRSINDPKSQEISKNIRVGPFLLEQHELGPMPITAMPMKSKQKRFRPPRLPQLNSAEPMILTTNTMTREPRSIRVVRPLEPNECEPGICIPGECDPYKCYERIKRRQVRSWGIGTDMISKDASNLYGGDSKSIGTQSLKERNRYSTLSQTRKNKHYEDRSGYVRDIMRHDGGQALRVGSNITFNIEFYKDSSLKKNFVALKNRIHDKEKEYYNRLKPKTRQAGVALEMIPLKNAESQGDGVKYENKASGVHNALKRCFCTLRLHDSNLKTRYMNRHSNQSLKLSEHQGKTVSLERKPKTNSKKNATESRKPRNSVCDKYPCTSSKRDIKVTELLTNELATSQRYLFIDDTYDSNVLPKYEDTCSKVKHKLPAHSQKKNQKVIAVNRVAVEETRRKYHKHIAQYPTEIIKDKRSAQTFSIDQCDSIYYRANCIDNLLKLDNNNKGPDLNEMNTIYPYVPSKFKEHKSRMLLIDNHKQPKLLRGHCRRTDNQPNITKMLKRNGHKRLTAKQGNPILKSENKKHKVFGWHFKAFLNQVISRFSNRKYNNNYDVVNNTNNPPVHNKIRKSKYALKTKQKDILETIENYRCPIGYKTKSKTQQYKSNETAASHNLNCKCSYKNNLICSYCQIKYHKIADSPYIYNKTAQFSLIPPSNINEERLNDKKTTSQIKVLGKYINLLKKNSEVITSKSKTKDILYKHKNNWTSPALIKDESNVPLHKNGKGLKRLSFKRSIHEQDNKSAIVGTKCVCRGCDNMGEQDKTCVSKCLVSLFKSRLLDKSENVFGKRACGVKKVLCSDKCQTAVPVQEDQGVEKSDKNSLLRSVPHTKKSLFKKSFFHKYVCGLKRNLHQRLVKFATVDTQCSFQGPQGLEHYDKMNPISEYIKDLSEKNVNFIEKHVSKKPATRCTCRVCQDLSKPYKIKPKSKREIKISDTARAKASQVMADRCRNLSGGDQVSNAICHQTRIQGHQRLKKVYQIPKSNIDDPPCIYKPLFSVGPNLCATCIEGEDSKDSRKFDNIGTEPKIKSCIKRIRCNQQFCTCTKKPCVCRVCPKTAKVIELSSGNWLSPVRHLFINDKYETVTNKNKIKYSTAEDTCKKMRTMLKIEGCGAKLEVIPKNAQTTSKTFEGLQSSSPRVNANSPNNPFIHTAHLSIDKPSLPAKDEAKSNTIEKNNTSNHKIKNISDAVVSTRNPQNSIMQKYHKVLENAKINKKKVQTAAAYKSHDVKYDDAGSPANSQDNAGCDKEECPVAREQHSQVGPWSKLPGIKGILDKSNRDKYSRDPTACYKDICPAGKNYKRAVKRAKRLEAKRKKKILEAAKRDKKNIEMKKKDKQKKKRDTELKKKEFKLNRNAIASANKAKRKEAILKSCVCSETCRTHLNKELDNPPEIPEICKIFDTCTCGASICAKEIRKARFAKLPPEMQELILEKRKAQKAAREANLKRIKQRTLEYQKQDRERLKKIQEQDAIQAKRVMKSIKNAGTGVLLAESFLDIGKLGLRASVGLLRFASRAVTDPKQVVSSFQDSAKDPKKLKKGVDDTLGSIGLMSTLSRVGKRVGSIEKVKQLSKKLEQNEYTNYVVNARSPKKRAAAASEPRRRGPPVDFGCSLFMATLRKKRCLAIYYLCPWFYPHCLSLLHIWRQITDVILFLLAVAVWSPCILAMELCRAFVCCAFCQA